MSYDKTRSVYAQLTSRIDKVQVYAVGATVTRVADLQINAQEIPEQVEIAGLPLALDDSSVRVRVESDGDTAAIATDVRIGLAVPPRQEVQNSPTEEEVREAKAEVRRIEDAIALIENEISVLYQLDVPKRPDGEKGKAPPPSPLSARLALANFKDEQVRARITEKRETQDKLRTAREHLDDLLIIQARASSAREVRPNELRKTAVVRLSYEGEPSAVVGQRLVVEYFIPGARWTPIYVCRLDSAGNSATIAVRALICQRTGEDWSGVRLELSTAEPMAWCELPELPSLRIGRAQPVSRKSGWRLPPIGAEILFEDFDRHKDVALSAVPKHPLITELSSVCVSPLPNLVLISEYRDEKLERQKIEDFQKSVDVKQALQSFDTLQNAADEAEEVDVSGAENAPVINLVNRILAKALQEGVSDIHVEPQEDHLRVRFRKDGVLRQAFPEPLPKKISSAVATRFKIMAKLDIGQRQLPQAGKIRRMYQGRKVDFFINTLPTRYGEKIVLDLQAPALVRTELWMDEDAATNLLTYSFMRMGAADDPNKRGKLSIEQRHEAYLEILKRGKVVVTFDVMEVVQQAVANAQNCLYVKLPPGGINVRTVAGSFDYAYSADGRVDVRSDGEFHSVALTSNSTDVDVRYVVVPREDTNVFRIAQLCNPLQAPLLAGPADVYVDGEYILSTNITTVPPKGQMELGLGVEQAIKVARNTTYQEARSGETLVAFNELRHRTQIDITNHLSREARIEVRERLPIPADGAKVDIQIDRVSPDWQKYEQQERGAPIRGGYHWRVQVPAREQTMLSVDYTIKTFVDSELIGGNRRE